MRAAKRPHVGLVMTALVAVAVTGGMVHPAAAAPETPTGPAAVLGTGDAPVPVPRWGQCPADQVGNVPPGLRARYQCATVEVPLSYRRPHGQSIRLAVGRLPATDQANKIGTLFFNPGGPGGSGRIPPALSPALHRRFDIVGFDPRGTNASTPLKCFREPGQGTGISPSPFPITPAQERVAVDRAGQATRHCARNGGPIMSHMSTANVARDLDLLRRAVGDEQLSYVGYSYGSHLGEVYANLFPGKVRALVIDGVLHPEEWTTGRRPGEEFQPFSYRIGSHLAVRKALGSFLRACAPDQRCAFTEPGATGRTLQRKYDALLDRLREGPVTITPPGGEPTSLTYQGLVGLVATSLYDAASSASLAGILQQVHQAVSAPAPANRRPAPGMDVPPPRYAPQTYPGREWLAGVACTDSSNPGDPYEWGRFARLADEQAEGFGSFWTYASLACATWPAADPDRYTGPWNRRTANPVLAIGNRLGDPATPYADARSTANLLGSGRLLSLDAFGHTSSYSGRSRCIDRYTDRYLIDKALPPPGTVCRPDRGPFDPAPTGSVDRRMAPRQLRG